VASGVGQLRSHVSMRIRSADRVKNRRCPAPRKSQAPKAEWPQRGRSLRMHW
jgi:hypothetical protein